MSRFVGDVGDGVVWDGVRNVGVGVGDVVGDGGSVGVGGGVAGRS